MANLSDSFPAAAGSNILEVVSGTCDGRSIAVNSGTYTLGDVTTFQSLSTGYVDLTGSSIAYTPPSNANHVLYRFDFGWDAIASTGISHFKLMIDGTEVVPAYKCISSNYSGSHAHHHGHHMESMFYNGQKIKFHNDPSTYKSIQESDFEWVKEHKVTYDVSEMEVGKTYQFVPDLTLLDNPDVDEAPSWVEGYSESKFYIIKQEPKLQIDYFELLIEWKDINAYEVVDAYIKKYK